MKIAVHQIEFLNCQMEVNLFTIHSSFAAVEVIRTLKTKRRKLVEWMEHLIIQRQGMKTLVDSMAK